MARVHANGKFAIPIFSFGDPREAKIATISLNPSDQEFLASNGGARDRRITVT